MMKRKIMNYQNFVMNEIASNHPVKYFSHDQFEEFLVHLRNIKKAGVDIMRCDLFFKHNWSRYVSPEHMIVVINLLGMATNRTASVHPDKSIVVALIKKEDGQSNLTVEKAYYNDNSQCDPNLVYDHMTMYPPSVR